MPAGNPEAYLQGGQGPGKQDKMAALEAMLGQAPPDGAAPEGEPEEEVPAPPMEGGEPVMCQVCGSIIDGETGLPADEEAPVEAGMPTPDAGAGGPQMPPMPAGGAGGQSPPF